MKYLESTNLPSQHARWITLTMVPDQRMLDRLFNDMFSGRDRTKSNRDEMMKRCYRVFGPRMDEWHILSDD